MNSRQLNVIKSFLLLFLFTCLGIFLHELSHHLLGIPSLLGLSRNYPLVPVTSDNINAVVSDNLAGPGTNLLLAFVGFSMYRFFTKNSMLNKIGMFLGLSNTFIALSGALINLIVDIISGSIGNDLEIASTLLGINILVLPLVFSLLSLIPFKTFWRDSKNIASRKSSFAAIIFIAWLSAGLFLMALDSIFAIRIN